MQTAQPDNIVISAASDDDFQQIQQIYAHYVLNATVTLEETPPHLEEMLARWKNSTDRSLPYIVAKDGGKVMGYAYAFPYRPRSAYRYTVEESIYITKDCQGLGIGKKLLNEIITQCSRQGYKQMLAVIAGADNNASVGLHKSVGFTEAGLLKNVGFKFGKWIDTIIMQRML